MRDKEEGNKGYRYVRTFEHEKKTVQVEEMDEKVLQAYINELLGVKDSKSADRTNASS